MVGVVGVFAAVGTYQVAERRFVDIVPPQLLNVFLPVLSADGHGGDAPRRVARRGHSSALFRPPEMGGWLDPSTSGFITAPYSGPLGSLPAQSSSRARPGAFFR